MASSLAGANDSDKTVLSTNAVTFYDWTGAYAGVNLGAVWTGEKLTASSSLAKVVDPILDKGIVIDACFKVSLVDIELLSIEALYV